VTDDVIGIALKRDVWIVFFHPTIKRIVKEKIRQSQAHEGWRLVPDHYDDGGLSGASLDRPALQALLADVRAGRITTVVVYKVDRLTRSLADFAKLVELFDQFRVSFVSRRRLRQAQPAADVSEPVRPAAGS
jgi:DNA invertase Pin-like site-specific DNA recombinase